VAALVTVAQATKAPAAAARLVTRLHPEWKVTRFKQTMMNE
jgi:hypothetical protein